MRTAETRTSTPRSRRARATRTILLSVLVAGVFGAAFALGRARGREPSRDPRAIASASANEKTSVTPRWGAGDPETARLTPDVGRVAEASTGAPSDAPHPDARTAVREALASDDVAVRIAGVERAVSQTSVAALSELERFRLDRDPAAAPTVIHAIALLGASAEGRERDRAAKTLTQWLREESKREGVDAVGNVSNLVEALGNLGGGDAAQALASALDGGTLPLHVQILAVQKLGELAEPRTRPSVERFAARAEALPRAEDLEEELRVEAIKAARDTLARL